MKLILINLLILVSSAAHAELKQSFIEFSGGIPYELSIQNPDKSFAYYRGIGIKTQINYNFSEDKDFGYGVLLGYKYLKLDNTKSGSVSESAIHKGIGAGAFVKYNAFYLGLTYSLMKAEHQSTGTLYALNDFKYQPFSLDVSYTIKHGNVMEIGPAYSYTTADISKDETGLTEDSPYKEHFVWLKVLFFLN